MKKILFCLLILVTSNLSAYENFALKLSPINFGFGFNSFEENTKEVDSFIVGFEHKKTRIGLEACAVSINFDTEIKSTSFLNFYLYWNIFNFNFFNSNTLKFFFGPYAKINTLTVNKETDHVSKFFDNYTFSAGMRVGLFLNFSDNVYWYILHFECGYRNINRTHNLYYGIHVDATWLIYSYFKYFRFARWNR